MYGAGDAIGALSANRGSRKSVMDVDAMLQHLYGALQLLVNRREIARSSPLNFMQAAIAHSRSDLLCEHSEEEVLLVSKFMIVSDDHAAKLRVACAEWVGPGVCVTRHVYGTANAGDVS